MSQRTYQLANGLSVYYVSKMDTDLVYQEIFEHDVYRRHGITISNGDCIVDVGANTGLFLLFLNQICTSARVVAIEPIPDIFAVLQSNLAAHNHLDISAINVGLSSTSGATEFTYFPRISCASTMYPDDSVEEAIRGEQYILSRFEELPNRFLSRILTAMPMFMKLAVAKVVRRYYAKRKVIRCELRTLSELFREFEIEKLDLLKLDAERSEFDILRGIGDDDWGKIRQAVVEVHEGDQACQQVVAILEAKGFGVDVDHNPEFSNIHMLYAKRPQ